MFLPSLSATVAGLVAGAALAVPAAATRPGPPLSEPAALLAASLHCIGDPAASARAGRTPCS